MFWYEDQYCRLNYYLFSLLNGMDDIDVSVRVLATSFALVVLILGIFTQSLTFYVHGTSLKVIMDVIPGDLATAAATCAIAIFHYNRKRNIQLLYSVENFYKEEECEEVVIMRENSVKMIKRIVKFITLMCPLGTTGIFSLAFTPLIFDIIAPLNESRPLELVFAAEFFIDKHKYFYPLFCYQFIGTSVIVIVVGSVLNIVIIALFSVSTFFRIVGYHLQSIGSAGDQREKVIDERLVREKVISCISKQRRIFEIVWLINQCGEWLIFMGFTATVIVFCFSAVQIMDPESFEIKTLIFSCAQLADVFIACLLGQHLIDVSTDLADKLYDSRWNDCSARIQKLLLIVLMKSQQPATIAFKGLLILCNKSLGSILQTAISYIMVLRQFQ